MNRIRKTKGFTLVEIMIVVLIIGILMAIAVPNFIKARSNSRRQTILANLKQIDGAKEQWAMEGGHTTGDACAAADLSQYIKVWPVDTPVTGTYAPEVMGTNPSFQSHDSDWWKDTANGGL